MGLLRTNDVRHRAGVLKGTTMSRIGRAFALIGGLLVAWIVLRIFVPAGYVNLILGTLLVIGTVGLAVKSLNFPPRVAWWLTAGALALVFVNLAIFPFLNHKFGWVAQSLEERTLWSSFRASDITNPKKNLQLHMTLYATERAEIKSRESVLVEALKKLQGKLSRGELLTDKERTVLQNVRTQLLKLDEEREQIRLSLHGTPSRVSQPLKPGDTVSVSIGTEYQPISVVWDSGVPPNGKFSLHPETDADSVYVRIKGKTHEKKGTDGRFDPALPDPLPDSAEVRGNRPQTMTIKVW